jgi:hypothetical protein
MATPEMIESWIRTETRLMAARDLVLPDVAAANARDLLQFAEFLDHNELGLAFDYLFGIAQESQWDSVPLLQALAQAAEGMEMSEELAALNSQISLLQSMGKGA